MNHAASYTLVGIGLADLFAEHWMHTPAGRLLSAWIAGFWFVRAVSQLYLGRRRGDFVLIVAFSFVGAVHLLAAVA